MKKFMIILLVLMMLPMIFAATDTVDVTDTFRLNELVNYGKPCFNNGTYCSASAVCNYTMTKPNQNILIEAVTAENNLEYHNTTVAVVDIGIHTVDMTCCDGGLCGAETFYFDVTGSGFNQTIGFHVLVLLLSFGVIIFGFTIKDGWITLLGTFGLYFFALDVLFNGLAGMKNTGVTWAVGIITLAIAFYISVKSGIELMQGE